MRVASPTRYAALASRSQVSRAGCEASILSLTQIEGRSCLNTFSCAGIARARPDPEFPLVLYLICEVVVYKSSTAGGSVARTPTQSSKRRAGTVDHCKFACDFRDRRGAIRSKSGTAKHMRTQDVGSGTGADRPSAKTRSSLAMPLGDKSSSRY